MTDPRGRPAGVPDLLIRARRVLTPDGVRPATVAVTGGRISAVGPYPVAPGAADPARRTESAVTDRAVVERGVVERGLVERGLVERSAGEGAVGTRAGAGRTFTERPWTEQAVAERAVAECAAIVDLADDEVLLPGLVDSHVHVNEPGRTSWEGFATATLAAAAGGITTIIDMPLNSIPPVTDPAALAAKRAAAAGQCHVDVGFWGGAVPGNAPARPRLHGAGVLGFKCFLVDSGVPEFPPLDDRQLDEAARQVAALGSILLVHAEDPVSIRQARQASKPGGADYAGFLRSRPDASETAAVARVVQVARRTGARVHILHLSSAAALPLIGAARRDGLPVTVETCPHYLALAAEDIADSATEFKCCPPIRERANRDQLWDALRAGTIDCVVSDHSPCPPELKRRAGGDFAAAWGGISSLQISLPVVWTQARARGFALADVAGWMSARPAQIAGLAGKGVIAPGRDADLVAFAPDESFVVDPARLHHRHRLTPYAGQRLHGVVRRAWLRGAAVPGPAPGGQLLARAADAW